MRIDLDGIAARAKRGDHTRHDVLLLVKRVAELQHALTFMHRRAQKAESIADTKVEAVLRQGWSLGRALANYGAAAAMRRAGELEAALRSVCDDLVLYHPRADCLPPTWALLEDPGAQRRAAERRDQNVRP